MIAGHKICGREARVRANGDAMHGRCRVIEVAAPPPPNGFHTCDLHGRPIVIFPLGMLGRLRVEDEDLGEIARAR